MFSIKTNYVNQNAEQDMLYPQLYENGCKRLSLSPFPDFIEKLLWLGSESLYLVVEN